MEPMLSNGDNLIVDKITYRFSEPKRFDIIVFPFKYQENTYYIKRIIGLPGEIVQIDEQGSIYINGELLEESYGREIIQPEHIGIASNPILLGEDEYFGTTVTTALTAARKWWAISAGRISSAGPGYESGLCPR